MRSSNRFTIDTKDRFPNRMEYHRIDQSRRPDQQPVPRRDLLRRGHGTVQKYLVCNGSQHTDAVEIDPVRSLINSCRAALMHGLYAYSDGSGQIALSNGVYNHWWAGESTTTRPPGARNVAARFISFRVVFNMLQHINVEQRVILPPGADCFQRAQHRRTGGRAVPCCRETFSSTLCNSRSSRLKADSTPDACVGRASASCHQSLHPLL